MFACIIALFATAIAHAGVKVTGLDWQAEGARGRFVVTLSEPVTATPEWDVKGGRFAMTLPSADIERNTVKKVAGVRLAAANTTRGVLATLTFPQGQINADTVALTLRDGKIEITTTVPAQAKPSPFAVASPVKVEAPKSTVKKEALGEDFLKKIEAEVAATERPTQAEPAAVARDVMAPTKDEVRSAQAAPARKDSFSFAGYAGKFIAFLGVVLLFFYGVTQLMKKGVLSKGKLGFLNNTQLVSVLSTTYVAPKRAILMVKAHNQVFLVSSSESGMSFIAEVRDVPGLVKEGERAITGTNFDDSAAVAKDAAPREELRVKENIYESTAVEEKGIQKDIVRFSDELKKKVKNLKSLQ